MGMLSAMGDEPFSVDTPEDSGDQPEQESPGTLQGNQKLRVAGSGVDAEGGRRERCKGEPGQDVSKSPGQ